MGSRGYYGRLPLEEYRVPEDGNLGDGQQLLLA